jgi:hypothetical protein
MYFYHDPRQDKPPSKLGRWQANWFGNLQNFKVKMTWLLGRWQAKLVELQNFKLKVIWLRRWQAKLAELSEFQA